MPHLGQEIAFNLFGLPWACRSVRTLCFVVISDLLFLFRLEFGFRGHQEHLCYKHYCLGCFPVLDLRDDRIAAFIGNEFEIFKVFRCPNEINELSRWKNMRSIDPFVKSIPMNPHFLGDGIDRIFFSDMELVIHKDPKSIGRPIF